MSETLLLPESLESRLPVRDCPGVAPNDGVPEEIPVLVHADKAMHLVGYSDRGYGWPVGAGHDTGEHIGGGELQVLPPALRILLSPSGL